MNIRDRYLQRLVVVQEADREMIRQDTKWGHQSHDPERWLAILTEEVGEVAKAINAVTFNEAKPEAIEHVETELVQVIAVSIQAIVDIRNKRLNPT